MSIFQPHVRPIPRGKTKGQIEFGSKLGVSLDNGFAHINTLSWDAYHEGGDLINKLNLTKSYMGIIRNWFRLTRFMLPGKTEAGLMKGISE